jgi:hypothetical protein
MQQSAPGNLAPLLRAGYGSSKVSNQSKTDTPRYPKLIRAGTLSNVAGVFFHEFNGRGEAYCAEPVPVKIALALI